MPSSLNLHGHAYKTMALRAWLCWLGSRGKKGEYLQIKKKLFKSLRNKEISFFLVLTAYLLSDWVDYIATVLWYLTRIFLTPHTGSPTHISFSPMGHWKTGKMAQSLNPISRLPLWINSEKCIPSKTWIWTPLKLLLDVVTCARSFKDHEQVVWLSSSRECKNNRF